MKISFLWWNTSLSPAGKDRATNEQKLYAQSMIDIFTQEINADFIALGEVSDNDISAITESCKLEGYNLFNGCVKAGRSHFDICALFRGDKFELLDNSSITANKGNRVHKIAQKLIFSIAGHDTPLHVFVSHWPSRLHRQQNHPERASYGIRLRYAIEELFVDYGNEATLVLLGDYNDEPFDHSLSEHLMATRDRDLAMSKPHLLYNPFWRRLGHLAPYSHDSVDLRSSSGTYFYKSGDISRWKTFDQIIFSSKFLRGPNWRLNEQLTQILDIPAYRELVMNPKQIFDHLPVMGVIEKVA